MESTTEIFKDFQEYLNADHDLREEIRTVVRELEQTAREIQTILQAIHQPTNVSNATSICDNASSQFSKVREHYTSLASKIPEGQYY
ncbi:translin, partial [Elysia marginata]